MCKVAAVVGFGAREALAHHGSSADHTAETPDQTVLDLFMAPSAQTIRSYHQRSKHARHRFAPGPGYLDWDTQPEPFRCYEGARWVDLPLDLEAPTRPFEDLDSGSPAPFDTRGLGRFLELALGLSAWKEFEGARWALRNNPSSGNLHPTEGWVVLPPLDGISGRAGLYHYSPLRHALEQRAAWHQDPTPPRGAFLFALSSVPWREAWKYGERAFRYCQHDTGHALAAAVYAGACLGWRVRALPRPSDGELAALLGLHRPDAHHPEETEHPELAAVVWYDPSIETTAEPPTEPAAEWHGQANQLSPNHVSWPAIDQAFRLTSKPETRPATPVPFPTPSWPASRDDAGAVIRHRRSAQRMDGRSAISKNSFLRMLARTLPDPSRVPWSGFPWPSRLALFLFVHRVEDIAPGLYALVRDPEAHHRLQRACDPTFLWQPLPDRPLPLFLLAPGDLTTVAAALSCGQDIAGDGVFSLAMVADFDRTLTEDGDWAYRRLFWEAGMIGQALYLEATAAGLSGTGIGCYFDDAVHALLGLAGTSMEWQSLYHFAVGRAVDDERLSTLPAYHHLSPGR